MSADPAGTKMRLADPARPLADFLAHPWPSDARKRTNGTIDLAALPNPTSSSTLEDYRKVFEDNTRAFGTTVASYVAFDGAIDDGTLFSDPLEAMDPNAPLYLVDVDARSPEKGRRFPLMLRSEDRATLYLPAHHLIALPPYGIPFRGGTTYALIGTSKVHAAGGAPIAQAKALHNALYDRCLDETASSIAEMFAPLRRDLADRGASDKERDDIRFATVFTTQDAVRDLRTLAAAARALPVPSLGDLSRVAVHADAIELMGAIEMPGFQSGTIPYKTLGDGGQIAYDAEGRPMMTHVEHTRVSVVIPRETNGRTMPSSGWPVVLYSHGTGGSYADAYDPAVGDTLAALGIAVVGYDQVLHGPRDPTGSNPDFTFFNLFNPIAGRDNVLQGTVDLATMTSLIQSGIMFGSDLLGDPITASFDPHRIAFLGHSQGSTVGAPFLMTDERVSAVAFSGLGSILVTVLLERTNPVDFKGLLTTLFSLPPDEVLDELHPIMNIIQTFIEPADAIAYAKSYPEDTPQAIARDVLIVEGLKDDEAIPEGTEAFASAAKIPVVPPVGREPPAEALIGPHPLSGDAQANAMTIGGLVTYGLIQYPNEGHFPIFQNSSARSRYAEFLSSALYEGRARISSGGQ
jgi:hypothetical protein